MKIERTGKLFTPVVLTIESQEELNYLYSISNSAITSVRDSASSLNIQLGDNCNLATIQMSLFNKLKEIYL